MSEWIRLGHTAYFDTGPETELEIETWYCCRPWPIVVSSKTHHGEEVKREAWFVRKCGICDSYPRPEEPNGILG